MQRNQAVGPRPLSEVNHEPLSSGHINQNTSHQQNTSQSFEVMEMDIPDSRIEAPTLNMDFLRTPALQRPNELQWNPEVPDPNVSGPTVESNVTANTGTTAVVTTSNNYREKISMDAFSKMIKEHHSGKNRDPFLLVDCRNPNSYSWLYVDYNYMVYAGLLDDKNIPHEYAQGFNSNSEVIRFFQCKAPNILHLLFEPGYYSDIILLDLTTPADYACLNINVMHSALIQWNKATRTKVRVLQSEIVDLTTLLGPNILSSRGSESEPAAGSTVSTSEGTSPNRTVNSVLMKYLVSHLKLLEDIIHKTKLGIGLLQKLRSLQAVKRVLFEEQADKLLTTMESQLPEAVKCPICFETFTDEIIQCGNGHSICGECSTKLMRCPECRQSYFFILGKVRNRALEKLVAEILTAQCPCGQTVKCKEILNHAKDCASAQNAEKLEVAELNKEIDFTETEMKKCSIELAVITTKNLWSEARWSCMLFNVHELTLPEHCKQLLKKARLKAIEQSEWL